MSKVAVTLLLDQLKEAHKQMEGTIEGVTDAVAAFHPQGKANPIAGTYAHLIQSEDFFIHILLQGKQPLFLTTWKDKTGSDTLQPTEWENAYPKWLREVKLDVAQARKYYQAVSKESEAYVASLTDKDLDREVDLSMFGMGNRKLSYILSGMVIMHINSIMGEVSVLKGLQDLRGYPF